MRSRIPLLALFSLALVACGGDGATAPSAHYDSIAGNYDGALVGLSQGIALNSLFSLTLTQTSGTLGGSYGLSGTLNNGFSAVDVNGTGTVSGSIAAGNNPSVNMSVRPGSCPSRTAQFSGSYDSANRRITLTGPVQFFAQDCSVVLTYATTFILDK